MKFKHFIFPILFCCAAIAIPVYKASIVCNSDEQLYLLEIKGRLTNRYLINNTYVHLIFSKGNDTIEPSFTWYSDDLISEINIGDSLYKTAYNDSCTIYKKNRYIGYDSCLNAKIENYKWSKRVLYGYSECPTSERKKIRHHLDANRNK